MGFGSFSYSHSLVLFLSQGGEYMMCKNKFEGKPCRVCGETLRYKSNKRCVECKGRIDHENYLARKEATQ